MPLSKDVSGAWQPWTSLQPLPLPVAQLGIFVLESKIVATNAVEASVKNWLIWNNDTERFEDSGFEIAEITQYGNFITLPRALVPGCTEA